MELFRFQLKAKLMLERQQSSNSPTLCEAKDCTCPATDLHEIVPRGTVGAQHYHALFVPELCSVLCNSCNVFIGNTQEVRDHLFRENIKRYGRPAVQQALDHLHDVMGRRTGIVLPKEDE